MSGYVGRAVLDLFIPRLCVVCGRSLSLHEEHICLDCLADLPRTYYSKMRRNRMADRLNDLIQRDLTEAEPYSYATSLFYYRASTGYRDITKGLKYRGDIASGRYFSGMLAEEMADSELYSDVDTVIPVPLHWTRRWSRGYNQAAEIGKVIARRLGATLRLDILKRSRRTKTQTRLSIEGKRSNVEGAFKIRRGADLSGTSHILLVDDVFTTGATLNSCRKVLKGVTGPDVRISVATLACVGD